MVRLQDLEQEYSPLVSVLWKSMPLRLGGDSPAVPKQRIVESRQRARAEEPRIAFSLEPPKEYPTSSAPALLAAKCAQHQGGDAFGRMHLSLFKALFEQNRNIASRNVLAQLAQESGLDEALFWADMDSGWGQDEVIKEFREFLASYSGFGIPLAVFPNGWPVEGAAPTAYYRDVIEAILKKQPGT
ncbi:MAG: DsbA family protein [Chloroflexi bacterium]|nr:DsbA family protein [Chloroflexota bacterium]